MGASYTGLNAQQARGATSLNNTNFFIADQGGFYTNGATTPSPAGNFRSTKSFGGTVYVAQSSSLAGTSIVSTISAASGGVITSLPGLTNNANMQDFYLIQSGSNGSTYDVLYTVFASSNTAGTISKFSLVSGNWVANGTSTTTFGGFGLAAEDNGGSPGASLYVTSGQGALAANNVLRIVDSAGYNATLALGTSTTIYTAPAGTTVKGISLVPVATGPEVNVQGNSVSIVDGDVTPDAADHTSFPATTVGNSSTRTFTIQNTGSANLTLGSFTSSDGVFTINNAPAGPIAPGGSATFDVVFTPTATGLAVSTISFVNNDSNENPYNFDVSGTGSLAASPEVDVLGNAVSIADGDTTPSVTDHTSFPNTNVAASFTRTFTIKNDGTANLTFSALASSNPDFAISGSPTSPILPGQSVTFDVIFTPSAAGLVVSTISFTNNDSNENPYNFDVSGTGVAVAPEVNLQGNAVTIADGDVTPTTADHTDFGNVTVGGTFSRTFTIQNTGTANLTLGAFTSSNPLFEVFGPSGPILPGQSATFDVDFTASSVGLQTSTISFVNNDSDENPYNFDVSGNGVAPAGNFYINEIMFNPSGTDAPNEFIEIRGTAGATLLPALTSLVSKVIPPRLLDEYKPFLI